MKGSFECSAVLNMGASNTTALFGAGNVCTFPQKDELRVIFGDGANVLPYDLEPRIFGLRDVIRAEGAAISLYARNLTFVIARAKKPNPPSTDLTASSLVVGVCNDLVLDGRRW